MVAPGQRSGAAPRYHPTRAHATLERGRRLLPGARWLVVPIPSPMIACHADHIGSLLRPPALITAREEAASGRISRTRFKAIEDRAVEDAIRLAGGRGPASGHRRRAAAALLPKPVRRIRERPGRLGPERVSVGRLARRFFYRRRSDDCAPRRTRGRGEAPTEAVFVGGRVRVSACAHHTLAQNHAAQPQPMGELLVSAALPRSLSHLGKLPRRRGGPPSRGSRGTGPAGRDATSSSTRPTMRCCSIRRRAASTSPKAGVRSATWNAASRWTTPSSGIFRALHSAFTCAGETKAAAGLRAAGTSGSRGPSSGASARSGYCSNTTMRVRDRSSLSRRCRTTNWWCSDSSPPSAPHLEPMDELERRIREASRFVPLERLAVSPQCGFSSSVIGNAITPADQERKLRLVVETARRVWGEDRISEDR